MEGTENEQFPVGPVSFKEMKEFYESNKEAIDRSFAVSDENRLRSVKKEPGKINKMQSLYQGPVLQNLCTYESFSGEHYGLLKTKVVIPKVAQLNLLSKKYNFVSSKMHILSTRAKKRRRCHIVVCAF
jgi:hypothetical protein